MLQPVRVIGIYKFGSAYGGDGFLPGVGWDLVVLCSILIHRFLLQKKGLWEHPSADVKEPTVKSPKRKELKRDMTSRGLLHSYASALQERSKQQALEAKSPSSEPIVRHQSPRRGALTRPELATISRTLQPPSEHRRGGVVALKPLDIVDLRALRRKPTGSGPHKVGKCHRCCLRCFCSCGRKVVSTASKLRTPDRDGDRDY